MKVLPPPDSAGVALAVWGVVAFNVAPTTCEDPALEWLPRQQRSSPGFAGAPVCPAGPMAIN